MNEYIRRWKLEHAAVRKTLTAISALDICSQLARDKMREAKDLILGHLKGEDEILYPMLKKVARKDVNMARMVELLAKEMDELAPKITTFFRAYDDDPSAKGLCSELDTVVRLLKARIDKEEDVLIKEYGEIMGRVDDQKHEERP